MPLERVRNRNIPDTYKEIELDEIPDMHPVFEFHNYYLENNTNMMIDRRKFHPGHVRYIIPWMIIFDVVNFERNTYYCRLHGTRVAELYGADYTGYYLEQCMEPDRFPSRCEEFAKVINNVTPVFSEVRVEKKNRQIHVYRAVLPVTTDGTKCDQLFLVAAAIGYKFDRLF